MRRALAFVALCCTLPFIPAAPAKAEIIYPFCYRQYEGPGRLDMEECSYQTFAQCMASASGRGGSCDQNPAWLARPQTKAKKRVVAH